MVVKTWVSACLNLQWHSPAWGLWASCCGSWGLCLPTCALGLSRQPHWVVAVRATDKAGTSGWIQKILQQAFAVLLLRVRGCAGHWDVVVPFTELPGVRQTVLSHVDSLRPYRLAGRARLSVGFSRQEYWGGLPLPPPEDLPDPMSLVSPALAGRFFTTSTTWEADPTSNSKWQVPKKGTWFWDLQADCKSPGRRSGVE